MNYNKILKRETKVIAYVVVCLTLAVMGVSYALFLQVNHNTKNQVVNAGSLEITYSQGNMITVDEDAEKNCLMPQSDEEGSKTGGCKFELSITNKGTLPVQYNLLIYDNTDTEETELPADAQFVSHSLVRHSLKKQYSNEEISHIVTPAAALSTLTPYNKDNSKKVLETSIIDVGETITFTLNIWISEDATAAIVGQYVYLKLDVVGTVFEQETAIQALTSSMDVSGLTEIVSDASSADENMNKEYRYVGSNPNNYVYFNCSNDADFTTCEKWRILGVYNVLNGTQTENRIKIIKDTSDTVLSWDSNSGVSYDSSTLYTYLNTDYYNGLSSSAKGKMNSATYQLGGADTLDINSKALYNQEVNSTHYMLTNVGLMSVSDYAFASGLSDADTIQNIASMNANNWLYKEQEEWFINKTESSTAELQVFSKATDGTITTSATAEQKLIRPVVYLAKDIKIIGGNGSSSNPYTLSK